MTTAKVLLPLGRRAHPETRVDCLPKAYDRALGYRGQEIFRAEGQRCDAGGAIRFGQPIH